MKKISFKLVWFDSLGAKSACTLVKTPDVSILIDPGAAVMHAGFPASWEKKFHWLEKAKRSIKETSKEAEVMVISHYHYDHYFPRDLEIYYDKILLAKDPNQYINDSQRRRAEGFYQGICSFYGGVELEEVLEERDKDEFLDPMDGLAMAKGRDFGDYRDRKQELMEKGKRWFNQRVANWKKKKLIPEFKFEDIDVMFADGRGLKFGKTKLRFTKPLFHGIEYSRVGWVLGTVIEYKKEKFLHSSDLNGPIIEDYADWIINENPDVLILDGPMTYMFGYLLNRVNLDRAINNGCEIVKETRSELIIYDHHLPREAKFRERVKDVYKVAESLDKPVLTAAEYLETEPKVLSGD